MNCFKLLLILLLPVPVMGQAVFVSFLPEDSQWISTAGGGELILSFRVDPAYHIQADGAQIQNEYLIPTLLSLTTTEGLSICSIQFPKPGEMLLGGTDRIQVFDGEFEVKIIVETTEAFQPDAFKGELYYQACDDRKCFFPRELAFEVQRGVK